MKEHVKTYEEAKIVIKNNAEETMKSKEGQKTYKLRALFIAIAGLGAASALALVTKQPLLIAALLPSVGIASFLSLVPLIRQKMIYNKIMSGSAFNGQNSDDVIKSANEIIDRDNLTERVRGNLR